MSLKLVRITTVPLSLEKLLEGQLTFMSKHFNVTAVSADKARLEKYGVDNKVETFHVEMTREITPIQDSKALVKLYRFLQKTQPNIVHTHTPKAGIVGMLAAKMAGVPVRLHTVAGMPLLEATGMKRKILNHVEKLTYASATHIYPNSYGLKNIIVEKNFSNEKKLTVLGEGSSNGIDCQYFDPNQYSSSLKAQIKDSLQIPKKDVTFIFVGRLVADKGINELILAFRKILAKVQKVSLLLVGPFEQDLDPISPSSVKEIETNPKIFTTGYQIDVRKFFAISDVLVFPSYREGFPNVVMQAGAMGIPSIVSNINGCNEIIEEGVNGCIIPVKDEEALYNSMYKILLDSKLRKKLASNSRHQIISRFERKEFWKILLQEYHRQIAGSG